MTAAEHDRFAARARIAKALAHPARLLMVEALADGPRCVCDLQRRVGSDMSTVSKHLTVLRHAGIMADEKRGAQVFYSLRCPCVLSFFECAEAILRSTAKTHARSVAGRGG